MKRQRETRKNIWIQKDTKKTKDKKVGKVFTGLSALFCAPCPASFCSAPPSSPRQSTICSNLLKIEVRPKKSPSPQIPERYWTWSAHWRGCTSLCTQPKFPFSASLKRSSCNLSSLPTLRLEVLDSILLLDLLEANCQPAWPLLPFSPPWTLSARELSLFLPGSVICMFHLPLNICSSQPSMVHWLSGSIFPCSVVRSFVPLW